MENLYIFKIHNLCKRTIFFLNLICLKVKHIFILLLLVVLLFNHFLIFPLYSRTSFIYLFIFFYAAILHLSVFHCFPETLLSSSLLLLPSPITSLSVFCFFSLVTLHFPAAKSISVTHVLSCQSTKILGATVLTSQLRIALLGGRQLTATTLFQSDALQPLVCSHCCRKISLPAVSSTGLFFFFGVGWPEKLLHDELS